MSSKRQKALSQIRAIVAVNGEVTSDCIRAYVENRISYNSFQDAIKSGINLFNSEKEKGSIDYHFHKIKEYNEKKEAERREA